MGEHIDNAPAAEPFKSPQSTALFEDVTHAVSHENGSKIYPDHDVLHNGNDIAHDGSFISEHVRLSNANTAEIEPWKPPEDTEIDFYLNQARIRDQRLADLGKMTSSFLLLYEKFSPLREKVLLLRSRARFQWNSCREYRRFVSESASAFIQEASRTAESDKLKSLYDQVLLDYQAQDTLSEKTVDMEVEIGDSEFEMQKKESSLAEIAENMLRVLNELALPNRIKSTTADEAESQSSSPAPSSVEYHPLLSHYYDKAGDVNVLRERLADLEIAFEEARANRQFQRDHEHPLEVSDVEFERAYLDHRHYLTEALFEANQVAELARKVCLYEGMDPDSFNSPKEAESTSAHSDVDESFERPPTPVSSDDMHIPNIVQKKGATTSHSLGIQPLPQDQVAPPPAHDRVQTWMENVEAPHDQQIAGEDTHTVSIRSPPWAAGDYLEDNTKEPSFERRSSQHADTHTQAFDEDEMRVSLEPSASQPKLAASKEDDNAEHELLGNVVSTPAWNRTNEEVDELDEHADMRLTENPVASTYEMDGEEVREPIPSNKNVPGKQVPLKEDKTSASTLKKIVQPSPQKNQHVRDKRLRFEEFKKVDKPREFFVPGKVFLVLWSEPGENTNQTLHSGKAWTRNNYGAWVFSKVRRFVVIKEDERACIALPIMTYNGQGVAKKGVKKSDHAVIFTGKQAPAPEPGELPSPGEESMLPHAIRVDPDERGKKLDEMSRLDFAKPQSVQHYCKVKSFGMVNRDSRASLAYQFRMVVSEANETVLRQGLLGEQSSGPGSTGSDSLLSQPRFKAAYAALIGANFPPDQAAFLIQHGAKAEDEKGEGDNDDDEDPGG